MSDALAGRGQRRALALSAIALVVAGCGAGQPKSTDQSGSPSISVSVPADSSTDKQAVADVYKKYFETLVTLGSADEATVRAMLAPYADGPAVENVVAAMSELREANMQPAGTVTFAALNVSIDGDIATVRECHDGATEITVDSASGAIISRGTVQGVEAKFGRASNGTWRMSSHAMDETAC